MHTIPMQRVTTEHGRGEYHKLAADTYDLFHGDAAAREVEFYHDFIVRGGGPALDIIAPGGQLLVESFLRTDHDSGTDVGQWSKL
jgi:hypothetical protein